MTITAIQRGELNARLDALERDLEEVRRIHERDGTKGVSYHSGASELHAGLRAVNRDLLDLGSDPDLEARLRDLTRNVLRDVFDVEPNDLD